MLVDGRLMRAEDHRLGMPVFEFRRQGGIRYCVEIWGLHHAILIDHVLLDGRLGGSQSTHA